MRRPFLTRILGPLLDRLAVLSLLLALGVAWLWWRSYSHPEHFWVSKRSGVIDSFKTHRGEFTIARRRTPYRTRNTEFFHETGPRVLERMRREPYPAERRWGPVVYAAVPAAPPPGPAQVREAEDLWRTAVRLDMTPAPTDEPELGEWTLRRARAYGRANAAQRKLNESKASMWLLFFPAWVPAALLLALPAVRGVPAWRRWRARLDAETGVCGRCGSRRGAGTADCPKCGDGRAPTPATAAAVDRPAASGSAPGGPVGAAGDPPAWSPDSLGPRPAGRIPAYARERSWSRPPPRRPQPPR